MNTLLETYAGLATAMLDDPFLALANAVAWLDPLWQMPDEDGYEAGEDAELALYTLRSIFPEIYVGAVEQIRADVTYAQLDSFICRAVEQRGIPLDSLECIPYGIPLPAYGVELAEPDFYTSHPDLARLLVLFAVCPEPDECPVEIPDEAFTVGRTLANSLLKQTDERWKQVGWALAWLFSCSGNSLIDCDDETLAEYQPMPWDEDNVAFAVEMIEEAEGILRDVDAGLKLLEADPDAFRALRDNVRHVCNRCTKGKEPDYEPRLRLHWPPLDRGANGAAVAGVELLQLRGDAA